MVQTGGVTLNRPPTAKLIVAHAEVMITPAPSMHICYAWQDPLLRLLVRLAGRRRGIEARQQSQDVPSMA